MIQNNHANLGKVLGKVRTQHGETLEQVAKRLGVTKSYLSKIENGHKPVPISLLEKYKRVYGNSAKFAELIGGHKVIINKGERKSEIMENIVQVQPPVQELQVNINAEKTPIMYSDWQTVNTNDGGVVLIFGQSMAPMPVQNVVSRIGMSHAQAKQLYGSIGEVLKEYYKSKGQEF